MYVLLTEDYFEEKEANVKQFWLKRNANFGMNLGMNLSGHWAKGTDLMQVVDIPQTLATLREYAAQPGFFESLIKTHFLDNPGRLVFQMSPKESYAQDLEKEEERRLKKKVDTLSKAERAKVLEDGKALLAKQEQKEGSGLLFSI
jgi:Zn-dependent M16 (insulinase) family peptidase